MCKKKRVKLIPFGNNVISDENSVEELMMTHLQFTQDVYLLKESVINSNIKSVIKSFIVFVLNKIMKKELDHYIAACRSSFGGPNALKTRPA